MRLEKQGSALRFRLIEASITCSRGDAVNGKHLPNGFAVHVTKEHSCLKPRKGYCRLSTKLSLSTLPPSFRAWPLGGCSSLGVNQRQFKNGGDPCSSPRLTAPGRITPAISSARAAGTTTPTSRSFSDGGRCRPRPIFPRAAGEEERRWALRMGLTGADSIEDQSIPTFARGELPHYAGINTFLKAPYTEDVTEVGDYDATVLGIPFDGGTTYRPGTRFGPQERAQDLRPSTPPTITRWASTCASR